MSRIEQKVLGGTDRVTVHIVGGGVMGLLSAIDLMRIARRLKLDNLVVKVYEAEAFGGGGADRTAGPRCQSWLHTDGQLYAATQPAVSLALQQSTRRLLRLVPPAFEHPLALTLEPTGWDRPGLAECYDALSIRHQAVSPEVVAAWFPSLRLQSECRIYRVRDATIDLRLLSYYLTTYARQLGVELIRQGVQAVKLRGDVVNSLVLSDANQGAVAAGDQVVLACGASIRPLLSTMGVTIPGLRLFQCHLLATNAFNLPALVAVAYGGPNCVPHKVARGSTVNVFGDSYRTELPADTDDRPLEVDDDALERICRGVEEWFGYRIPQHDRQVWPAVKTELVVDGDRSQSYHVCHIPELQNMWLAIPGKLSLTAICSQELAAQLTSHLVTEPTAWPIWEADQGDRDQPVQVQRGV